MIVYHGSSEIVTLPDLEHGRKDIDFGLGFYLTKDKRMAEKWASGKDPSMNNVYELSLDGLNVVNLGLSRQWLEFVSYNRGYSKDKQFDISGIDVIVGPVADDKMFETINAYLKGDLSTERTIQYLNIAGYSDQIVLKTDKAIQNLTYIKSKEIFGQQKALLKAQVVADRRKASQDLEQFKKMDRQSQHSVERLVSDENSRTEDSYDNNER